MLCWCEGRETWQSAEFIAELQAAFGVTESTHSHSQRYLYLTCKFCPVDCISRVDSKTELAIFEKAIAELEDEKTEQEESFVDDDGTQYVWNSELKKYEPQEETVKDYDEETMTFHGIEEDRPTLEDALKKAFTLSFVYSTFNTIIRKKTSRKMTKRENKWRLLIGQIQRKQPVSMSQVYLFPMLPSPWSPRVTTGCQH